MKSGLSLIGMIIDASTSMTPRQSEVIQAVNEALKTHREAEGEAIVSIYQFSNETTKIVDFKNIKEVSEFTYNCMGWTALRDAIGYTINDLGTKLALMSEDERPEHVQIMIITDGEENSSRLFSAAQIREMVTLQTSKYSWIFTYLGSNQDAILAGNSLGISKGFCANYSDNNLSGTIGLVSRKMSFARSATNSVDAMNMMSYTDNERESLVK